MSKIYLTADKPFIEQTGEPIKKKQYVKCK